VDHGVGSTKKTSKNRILSVSTKNRLKGHGYIWCYTGKGLLLHRERKI
jgi:hypothetical protein